MPSLCVLVISHSKQPCLARGDQRAATQMSGTMAGRWIRKKHDLNKQSESPQNRNAGTGTWTAADQVWLSPHRPNRAPMCWDSGAAFLPLIARLGPSSTTSRVKTLGPCGVCARGLQRGEKAKPGKAQRVYRLLHMMHAPKRRAGAAAAPSRSKREGRPRPPQAGRFDQPCGKTVPSGNLGPMQREREALLHYLLETTAK